MLYSEMFMRYDGEDLLLAIVGCAPLCGLLFMEAATRHRLRVAERVAKSLGGSRVVGAGSRGGLFMVVDYYTLSRYIAGRAARTWAYLCTCGATTEDVRWHRLQ